VLELFPDKRWHKDGVDFHALHRNHDGAVTGLGRPIEFEAAAEGAISPDGGPTFFLRTDQVQRLMDQLWTLGFRPSEGTGSAGALKQAEAHIDSLRKIAYGLLPK
jgi:hypothetical protein